MKKLTLITFLTVLLLNSLIAKPTKESITLQTDSGNIYGTLLCPESTEKVPLVLIIAGSGPTDRNGNGPMMINNSLKMIGEGLLENNIASVRFDKRGIAKSTNAGKSEIDLRFEHYIQDVKDWVAYLKKDNRFDKIIILGHSEGSLIGMIASQNSSVDKFISVAGVAYPAGEILREQLKEQPPIVLNESLPIIEKLEQGKTVSEVPQRLNSLFRPSVQPYMISWFKYNPQIEIAKLKYPILIVQGTTDIQVSLDNADKLTESNELCEKVVIKGMNHILKNAESDRTKNIQTYNNPRLPLAEDLVPMIVNFINK